jgi:hypothetical protein
VLPLEIKQSMIQQIELYRNFGLGYNNLTASWYLITSTNLNADYAGHSAPFSRTYAQDTSGQNLDASWLVQFLTDGSNYVVSSRSLQYKFASVIQTRFFYSTSSEVYDSKTGLVIKDFIRVLKTNSRPDSNEPLPGDVTMDIIGQPIESDGFVNDYEVIVSYRDSDADGVADNPDFFDDLVAPNVNASSKLTFFQLTTDFDDLERYLPMEAGVVNSSYATLNDIELVKSEFIDGQVFYAYSTDKFYKLLIVIVNSVQQRTLTEATEYIARVGRSGLSFQYRHNSALTNVIDPGTTNIIDMYVVTQSYYTAYQNYIKDTTGTVPEPAPPDVELSLKKLP